MSRAPTQQRKTRRRWAAYVGACIRLAGPARPRAECKSGEDDRSRRRRDRCVDEGVRNERRGVVHVGAVWPEEATVGPRRAHRPATALGDASSLTRDVGVPGYTTTRGSSTRKPSRTYAFGESKFRHSLVRKPSQPTSPGAGANTYSRLHQTEHGHDAQCYPFTAQVAV